jgi:hypothetical protein
MKCAKPMTKHADFFSDVVVAVFRARASSLNQVVVSNGGLVQAQHLSAAKQTRLKVLTA